MLYYTDEQLSSKEMHVQIAQRLHTERVNAGFSLDALADKTGYTKPTVQSWEKGWKDMSGKNKIPTLEQLLDLCAVYNCTPEYLLCEYDFKSKQITDISFETGLLPESITKLQQMFYPIIESYNLSGGANDIFLAFLNHYMANIDLINELLFNRSTMEYQRIAFEEDPYHDILLEAYNAVCLGSVGVNMFRDGIFSDKMGYMLFTEPMTAYFESKGYDRDTIVTLMEHFSEHYEGMSNNKIKQSDYALSESFIEIVKSFYDNYLDSLSEYNAFVKKQSVNVSPERIRPPRIIR